MRQKESVRRVCMRGQEGFTLIELMMAATLLVSGLIVFGIFSGNLTNKNEKVERQTLATTLAQEKIEELKNSALNSTISSSNDGTDIPSTGLNRQWTISSSNNNMNTITVTVTWSGPGSVSSRTVSLSTQITQ